MVGGITMAALAAVPAGADSLPRPPLQDLGVSGAHYTLTEKADQFTTPPAAEYAPVGIDGALTGTDRTALPGQNDAACAKRAGNLPGAALPTGSMFCWDTAAQGDKGNVESMPWVPQGIATSGEAQLDGIPVGGKNRAAVISWTWQNSPKGTTDYRHNSVKLAFANLDDKKYRFVLPVWVDGAGKQRRIYGHAGGLAWYGPYLFMSDTGAWNGQTRPGADKPGIRVFDTRKIYRKKDGGGGDYQYVMPEVRSYLSGGASFHFLSLDRHSTGGASLVGGTYKTSKGSPNGGTELYRYRFGDDYRLQPKAVQGWKSTVTQDGANAISDVQGVQADGDTLFVNMSKGSLTNRRFATVGVAGSPADWTIKSRKDWAFRPQDLSLWYGTQELWGLTEGEEERVVFSVKTDLLR
ncbi:hypothetical protein AB0I22_09390 [Streptomyces sp. NPDC050610]|uniref:hypothetical protein n=1 Tax=Streptomyces sp. NPDC050610 TaxID=3157097 RepID=UPI00344A8EE1